MKQMYSVLIASLSAICTISQHPANCKYGEFANNNGQCMFDCENGNNYVEIATLSFDFIREACVNVNTAATHGLCSSLTDLVYSTSNCTCPCCKCTTQHEHWTLKELKQIPPQKTCYNCTCHKASDSSITDLVYECEELINVYEPHKWRLYDCPPKYCKDSSGNLRSPGGFFDTVAAGQICDRYCHCDGDGTKDCRDGFHNIINSNPYNFKTGFDNAWFEQCDYSLKDCLDDPSRMFQTEVGPSCHSCPRCNCGSHALDDTWYIEYQDFNDVQNNRESCALCECKEYTTGVYYADCAEIDSGTGTCPPDLTSSSQCHEDAAVTGTVGTLSPRSCTSARDDTFGSYIPYCQWTYDFGTDGYEGIESYEWNCGSSIFCEAYADGECSTLDYEFDYIDCYGVGETVKVKQSTYCCKGENCNHKNINTSTCTPNEEYPKVFKSFYECMYGKDSKYWEALCNDDDVGSITCKDIQELYGTYFECLCQFYSALYNAVGAYTQASFAEEIKDVFIESKEWNEVFGCDIDLSCDLITGVLVNKEGVSKFYAIAILWAIVTLIIQQ